MKVDTADIYQPTGKEEPYGVELMTNSKELTSMIKTKETPLVIFTTEESLHEILDFQKIADKNFSTILDLRESPVLNPNSIGSIMDCKCFYALIPPINNGIEEILFLIRLFKISYDPYNKLLDEFVWAIPPYKFMNRQFIRFYPTKRFIFDLQIIAKSTLTIKENKVEVRLNNTFMKEILNTREINTVLSGCVVTPTGPQYEKLCGILQRANYIRCVDNIGVTPEFLKKEVKMKISSYMIPFFMKRVSKSLGYHYSKGITLYYVSSTYLEKQKMPPHINCESLFDMCIDSMFSKGNVQNTFHIGRELDEDDFPNFFTLLLEDLCSSGKLKNMEGKVSDILSRYLIFVDTIIFYNSDTTFIFNLEGDRMYPTHDSHWSENKLEEKDEILMAINNIIDGKTNNLKISTARNTYKPETGKEALLENQYLYIATDVLVHYLKDCFTDSIRLHEVSNILHHAGILVEDRDKRTKKIMNKRHFVISVHKLKLLCSAISKANNEKEKCLFNE